MNREIVYRPCRKSNNIDLQNDAQFATRVIRIYKMKAAISFATDFAGIYHTISYH